MKCSQCPGTKIVSTLSRLVLALAFITAGYNKLFTTAEFSATDAATLQSLGVDVKPVGDMAQGPFERRVVLATLSQPVPVGDLAGEAADAAEDLAGEAEDLVEETAGDAQAPAITPLPDGMYTAKKLHWITLRCNENSWKYPWLWAHAAAITEFIGGGLLLVGFLSRLWGLGLAITMGVAFYMVSIGINGFSLYPPGDLFAFAADTAKFNTLMSQLGLGVLALAVMLTGPGPLSIDRVLFPPHKKDGDNDDSAGGYKELKTEQA